MADTRTFTLEEILKSLEAVLPTKHELGQVHTVNAMIHKEFLEELLK